MKMRPARRTLQSGEQAQGRRLAAARWAEKGQKGTVSYMQIERGQRLMGAERLRDLLVANIHLSTAPYKPVRAIAFCLTMAPAGNPKPLKPRP